MSGTNVYIVRWEGLSEEKVVEATCFGEAVRLWRESMREAWGDDWEEDDEPCAVEFIADGPVVRAEDVL